MEDSATLAESPGLLSQVAPAPAGSEYLPPSNRVAAGDMLGAKYEQEEELPLGDVLQVQQMMNEWSYMMGMTSSTTKTFSDALKSIGQRIQ